MLHLQRIQARDAPARRSIVPDVMDLKTCQEHIINRCQGMRLLTESIQVLKVCHWKYKRSWLDYTMYTQSANILSAWQTEAGTRVGRQTNIQTQTDRHTDRQTCMLHRSCQSQKRWTRVQMIAQVTNVALMCPTGLIDIVISTMTGGRT